MNRLSALCLIPALFSSALCAEEITVEQHPFTITESFTATVLPDDGSLLLQIEPKTWSGFEIVELATHGTLVNQDDTLIRFDSEAIDKDIADTRSSLATSTLSLAQAELDLKHLVETSPHRLDSLRRIAAIAAEENTYFTLTRRKATEDAAEQFLERKKQMLENQEEELRQLAKMYEADDLTEDTEEIILVRQKNDVISAKFALRMQVLEHERTLKVKLPNDAIDIANEQRDTAIALAKAEKDIPRSIKLKELEVEALKTSHQRSSEHFAELENDRTLFEIKAPVAGTFYHGPIKDGRWSPAVAVKTLVIHGKPALNRPFATLVPAASPLSFVAFLDQKTASSLSAGLEGIATFAGREQIEIPVQLEQLATLPGSGENYRADFSATWPEGFTPAIGSSANVRLIAYHQAAAISVPSNALSYESDGWTLEVKLADGNNEHRPVKRGRVSGEKTEILSGLEIGQVILAP